ncbi:GMC family oxidoreductase N-terminal domain-containing protein [Amycolatopsis sp. NBC_00345]|uniref:GMC family oxidoreductase n=1 Tax=Amycolatopsis sp. NBC_00345 TaxID=2975955 RepID=UPI002E260BE2
MGDLPDEVDVVVVGAGAAGCVLAARLSEEAGCRVLLLEAGSTTGLEPEARTPGAAMRLWTGPTSWGDTSVPQPALGGRRVTLPQGRGLGGGSSINGMAWFHGYPADYDAWQAGGAHGWAWKDVRPVFRAIEHNDLGDAEWHGFDGPMRVSRVRDASALALSFVAAGAEIGLPVVEDFNGADREGIGLLQANINDGTRHSVVDGYLLPAAGRPNLTIRAKALVTSIVVESGRATAVQCVDAQGVRRRVVARRSIVVAAGAIRTPQLLMLSGIGMPSHLRKLGIDVVHDLPAVGADLQDHPLATTVWPVVDGSPLWSTTSDADARAYQLLRRGPLASFTQATAKLRTREDLPGPNIQLTLALTALDSNRRAYPEPALTCSVSLLTPTSRGEVRLASADPTDAPLVDPGYLRARADREDLLEGLRLARRLFQGPALKAATGGQALDPPAWDEESLGTFIRDRGGSEWHPVGTCRMGTDSAAVVDSTTMEVNGVLGLHIADASVMPAIPRANTHAPTIMIAERAAQLIREAGAR